MLGTGLEKDTNKEHMNTQPLLSTGTGEGAEWIQSRHLYGHFRCADIPGNLPLLKARAVPSGGQMASLWNAKQRSVCSLSPVWQIQRWKTEVKLGMVPNPHLSFSAPSPSPSPWFLVHGHPTSQAEGPFLAAMAGKSAGLSIFEEAHHWKLETTFQGQHLHFTSGFYFGKGPGKGPRSKICASGLPLAKMYRKFMAK